MEPTNRWISLRDCQAALQCSRQRVYQLRDAGSIRSREVGASCEYLLETLPSYAQGRYWEMYTPASAQVADAELYANAPEYSRKKADKYLQLFAAAGDLAGGALKDFICRWNTDHPEFTTSYSRLVTERSRYRDEGVSALLGKWGKRSCATKVPDSLFSVYKALYMAVGAPSVASCWATTLGYAKEHGMDIADFPSQASFARRMKNEVPEQAVYTARKGASAANRRYGFFIKRDYSKVLSGECWVSDHAMIDVACTFEDRGISKVGYPWITAWRDFKSGFWVGGDIHIEAPNSDHIFMSFYRASVKHGIPLYLIIDNGKDYRCKDFAGGRKHHRVSVDEPKTTSLTSALGITTMFAWPYNAQSKPIERDFLRVKEWFSKHNEGYRGGNVIERPETHNEIIAAGKILPFNEVKKLLGFFIEQIMMQAVVSSGYRAGKAPIDIWTAEYPIALETGKIRQISKQSLKLFCSRTSGVVAIGRRGVHDSQLGVDYYDAWMEGQRGRKVYIRRDPLAMQEAFVFNAANDEYLGSAPLIREVHALAVTDDVSKKQLREAIAVKRQSNKIMRILSNPGLDMPFHQKLSAMAAAKKIERGLLGLPKIENTVFPTNEIISGCVESLPEQKDTVKRLMDFTGLVDDDGDSDNNDDKLAIFDDFKIGNM